MSDKICGRTFETKTGVNPHIFSKSRKPQPAKPKVTVDGIFHRGGKKLIKFRSRERAERHIINMGLQRG